MILLSIAAAGSKALKYLAEEHPIATLITLFIILYLIFSYLQTQYGWKEGGKPFLIALTKWLIAPIVIILTLIKIITFFISSNSTVDFEKGKELLKLGSEPWEIENRLSAFNRFNEYIENNPETDSAYYYRSMCFLESYKWSNREGLMAVYDFNSRSHNTNMPSEIRLPSEYTFASAISDLRMANSHNSNIQVSNQINSAIFKSIILTIENNRNNPTNTNNSTNSNYFQDIPETELKEFLSNLKKSEYKDVPYYSIIIWTAMSIGNSDPELDDAVNYYQKHFNDKEGLFLLNCWIKADNKVKEDISRFREYMNSYNLEVVGLRLADKYCGVIANGKDTIHVPIDSIGLNHFIETKLVNSPAQIEIRP